LGQNDFISSANLLSKQDKLPNKIRTHEAGPSTWKSNICHGAQGRRRMQWKFLQNSLAFLLMTEKFAVKCETISMLFILICKAFRWATTGWFAEISSCNKRRKHQISRINNKKGKTWEKLKKIFILSLSFSISFIFFLSTQKETASILKCNSLSEMESSQANFHATKLFVVNLFMEQ